MASSVTGGTVSPDRLYGASHESDALVNEELNANGLSLGQVSVSVQAAVRNQIPVALYNWDLKSVPSLNNHYELDRLRNSSVALADSDWCNYIALEPQGPPSDSGDFLKDGYP